MLNILCRASFDYEAIFEFLFSCPSVLPAKSCDFYRRIFASAAEADNLLVKFPELFSGA
jgi:hypothetical protein